MKKLIWAVLCSFFAVLLAGCGKAVAPEANPISTGVSQKLPYAKGEELFCLVNSEEEAVEIARLYGFELVSCRENVATFHTDEAPEAVIERGKANGWPLVEINYLSELH